MNIKDLLFNEITNSALLKDQLIKKIRIQEKTPVEFDPNSPDFQSKVVEYMGSRGIELNQTNFDQMVNVIKKDLDLYSHFISTDEHVETKNLLEDCSEEDMKEILQICLLKQCEEMAQLLKKNSPKERLYKYAVESIRDSYGSTNEQQLQKVMNDYAEDGWKVISVFTNEMGHNSLTIGNVGTNSTVDEVVIIFEKCVSSM